MTISDENLAPTSLVNRNKTSIVSKVRTVHLLLLNATIPLLKLLNRFVKLSPPNANFLNASLKKTAIS